MIKALSIPILTEPVPVVDDFVQGIAKIEQVGPCARFILFSDQTLWEAGIDSRVIVRKIRFQRSAVALKSRCGLRLNQHEVICGAATAGKNLYFLDGFPIRAHFASPDSADRGACSFNGDCDRIVIEIEFAHVFG